MSKFNTKLTIKQASLTVAAIRKKATTSELCQSYFAVLTKADHINGGAGESLYVLANKIRTELYIREKAAAKKGLPMNSIYKLEN